MKSMKKYMKKLEIQERTNPGHKTKYEAPWQGYRPTTFTSSDKKRYNRQAMKRATRAEAYA